MTRNLFYLLLLCALTHGKDPELPLCPTDMQYFPQTLPMHCRMPPGVNLPVPEPEQPFLPTFPPEYRRAPSEKGLPIVMPPGLPRPLPFPPMGMPIPAPVPNHKLPVIVMPFYSPDPNFKKEPPSGGKKKRRKKKKRTFWRPPQNQDSDSDESSTSDSENDNDMFDPDQSAGFWHGRRAGKHSHSKHSRRNHRAHHKKPKRKKQPELITPVIQYVTKDGYVIYEKELTKGEATEWLTKPETKPENRGQSMNDLRGSNVKRYPAPPPAPPISSPPPPVVASTPANEDFEESGSKEDQAQDDNEEKTSRTNNKSYKRHSLAAKDIVGLRGKIKQIVKK